MEQHLRPLTDCLDDFWSGADHLPTESEPLPPAPALPRLGPSGISVRGRDLAAVLRPAYEAFTRRADGPSH